MPSVEFIQFADDELQKLLWRMAKFRHFSVSPNNTSQNGSVDWSKERRLAQMSRMTFQLSLATTYLVGKPESTVKVSPRGPT
jgi:hypothetical protein